MSQQPQSKKEQKALLVASVVTSFNDSYGRDDSKLAIWQRLCKDLDVQVGSSITQCKKAKLLGFAKQKKKNWLTGGPLDFEWRLREHLRLHGGEAGRSGSS